MTLPAIFISGPFAGFILGHFILKRWFGFPNSSVLFCVFLGFLASGVYTFQLLKRFKDLDSKIHKDASGS